MAYLIGVSSFNCNALHLGVDSKLKYDIKLKNFLKCLKNPLKLHNFWFHRDQVNPI